MNERNRPGHSARAGAPTPPGWTNRSAAEPRPLPASLPQNGRMIIRSLLFGMERHERERRGAAVLFVLFFLGGAVAQLIDAALP